MEELLAKLAEANAKTEAWVAEDPQNRWAGTYVLDSQHWIDRGITSLVEFDRYELENAYCELYKDVHGFRPMNVSEMPTVELEADMQWLIEESDRQVEEERKRQTKNVEKFEALISETMSLVTGCDRKRAIEIIADAEGELENLEFYGYEHIEWHFNLPYGYIKNEA